MREDQIKLLDQLDQLEDILLDSTRFPFSSRRLIDEHEFIDLLDTIRENMPSDFKKATDILKDQNRYLDSVKKQAKDIIDSAEKERDILVSQLSVQKQAKIQIDKMREKAYSEFDLIRKQNEEKACILESKLKEKLSELDNLYSQRKISLDQEYKDKRKSLDLEIQTIKQRFSDYQDSCYNKSLAEIEEIKKRATKSNNQLRLEAERIRNNALNLKARTEKHCELMLSRSKEEALSMQAGANQYAENTLKALETRLQGISHVVSAGRNELNEYENINSDLNTSKSNNNMLYIQQVKNQARKIKEQIMYRS